MIHSENALSQIDEVNDDQENVNPNINKEEIKPQVDENELKSSINQVLEK